MSNQNHHGVADIVTPDGGEHIQYLTFMLQKETYALAIRDIREIIEYSHPTAVPTLPGFIRGVINLRGGGVPVIDIRAHFEAKKSDIGRRTCIVILEIPAGEYAGLVIGLIVDEVNEVLEIPASEIELLPAIGADRRADVIKAMGKINDRFVLILDVVKILSTEECSLLSQEGRQIMDMTAA